jgi:hypothetical protein
MKNKTGMLVGFVLGVTGFLFLFKVIILDRHTSEDELAPGIVVIASIICGAIFAFIGKIVQSYFAQNG